MEQLSDWAQHLQRIIAVEKHAHHELNTKMYNAAYEHMLEIEHHCRMTRAWILQEKGKEQ
jgi:hypothetical protein